MSGTLITTTAGPLCITHLDYWSPRIEHTDKDTYIRLVVPYHVAPEVARGAMALVSIVNRNASLESLVQDACLHLQAQPGVEDVRINFFEDGGARWGQVHYRLKVSAEEPESADMLLGLLVLRRFHHQAVRFDHVAEEAFFIAHYRETLVMSRTIELVN